MLSGELIPFSFDCVYQLSHSRIRILQSNDFLKTWRLVTRLQNLWLTAACSRDFFFFFKHKYDLKINELWKIEPMKFSILLHKTCVPERGLQGSESDSCQFSFIRLGLAGPGFHSLNDWVGNFFFKLREKLWYCTVIFSGIFRKLYTAVLKFTGWSKSFLEIKKNNFKTNENRFLHKYTERYKIV